MRQKVKSATKQGRSVVLSITLLVVMEDKIHVIRGRKKYGKTPLTKARNKLSGLLVEKADRATSKRKIRNGPMLAFCGRNFFFYELWQNLNKVIIIMSS